MPDVSPIAVATATVAAFFVSSTYYALFSTKMATLRGADSAASTAPPAPSKLAAEVLRSLVTATAVAAVIARGQIDTASGVLLLAGGRPAPPRRTPRRRLAGQARRRRRDHRRAPMTLGRSLRRRVAARWGHVLDAPR